MEHMVDVGWRIAEEVDSAKSSGDGKMIGSEAGEVSYLYLGYISRLLIK